MTESTAPRGVIIAEIVDSWSRAMLSMDNSIDAVVTTEDFCLNLVTSSGLITNLSTTSTTKLLQTQG